MVSEADILNANILIVDDVEANVRLLEATLHGAGYTSVTSTMDPYRVYDLHLKNCYDLILLDLLMPGMDGFQVMEGLKEIDICGYLPVLVVTAQPEHKLRALRAGAKDFISKPFELIEVLTRAHNILEVRLLHVETTRHSEMLEQTLRERVQAEEEVRELNAELERRVTRRTAELLVANKELEAFSYSVSHDLRAPLRGIDGWSQALLEDYSEQLDETGREYLHRVRSETQRMGHLIDDILDLARVMRSEKQTQKVDLSALARRVVARLCVEFPDQCVDAKIAPDMVAVGDPRLIEIVLTNLIGNAFKFTGKTQNPVVEFGETVHDGVANFFVRDNGAGFDMAFASKLFGAFQRMHKASEFAGSGVGLATVQRIVNRHGGRIWAESTPEQGATFSFTLQEAA